MRQPYLLIILLMLMFYSRIAGATPFFARTYHFSCQTCHNGYPRLNDFGQAFKANGFRIPGAEKTAPLAWKKTVPLAVQVLPTQERFSPGQGHAEFTDTQLLAGGLLTPRTSFYLHHSLWIDDKPVEFPSYEVWVEQVLDERTKTMVKVGQFELPYNHSPGTHQITVFGPLLYGAGLQGNDVRPGAPMRGVQFRGMISDRVRWYLAVGAPSVLSTGNTAGKREFLGEFRDVYIRASSRNFSRNIGGFLYLTSPTRDPSDPSSHNDGQRYGLEGTYLWKEIQFDGMAVYGENSNPLGNKGKGVLRGMFVEASKMIRPWVGVTGRWEAQTASVGGVNTYTDAKTLGLRFYPLKDRNLLRLNAEYQQGDHGRSATAIQASVSF